MKTRIYKFNIYLALVPLLLASGCTTWEANRKFSKEEQSNIRLYLEGNSADVSGSGAVLVTRDKIPYVIQREPSLTEADLRKVQFLDDPGREGGYSIALEFNEHGSILLDMLTTANRGRHIIVYSQFPPKGYKPPKEAKKTRKDQDDDDDQMVAPLPEMTPEMEKPGAPRVSAWLAAYLIRDRNTTGRFIFTPDASREEGKRIVLGLKHLIAYEKAIGRD